MADLFAWYSPIEVSWYQFLPLIPLAIAAYHFFSRGQEDERAVVYAVKIPEPCQPDWKGEILDEPSIKVCLD